MGLVDGDGELKAIDTKFIRYAYKIDYDKCYKNNFKNNVEKALKFYLASEDNAMNYEAGGDSSSPEIVYKAEATGFILYPQALNPFLKIMETLKQTNRISILPAYNQDQEEVNLPAYLIVHTPMGYPVEIVTKDL